MYDQKGFCAAFLIYSLSVSLRIQGEKDNTSIKYILHNPLKILFIKHITEIEYFIEQVI